jgi:hypothetical protein
LEIIGVQASRLPNNWCRIRQARRLHPKLGGEPQYQNRVAVVHWSFGFEIRLGFGAWSLELSRGTCVHYDSSYEQTRLEFGAWSLELGLLLAARRRPAGPDCD